MHGLVVPRPFARSRRASKGQYSLEITISSVYIERGIYSNPPGATRPYSRSDTGGRPQYTIR